MELAKALLSPTVLRVRNACDFCVHNSNMPPSLAQ
jgi:hypothetical protein